MDPLATMTPEEYRTIRAELQKQGKWNTAETHAQETESNAIAVQLLSGIRN